MLRTRLKRTFAIVSIVIVFVLSALSVFFMQVGRDHDILFEMSEDGFWSGRLEYRGDLPSVVSRDDGVNIIALTVIGLIFASPVFISAVGYSFLVFVFLGTILILAPLSRAIYDRFVGCVTRWKKIWSLVLSGMALIVVGIFLWGLVGYFQASAEAPTYKVRISKGDKAITAECVGGMCEPPLKKAFSIISASTPPIKTSRTSPPVIPIDFD